LPLFTLRYSESESQHAMDSAGSKRYLKSAYRVQISGNMQNIVYDVLVKLLLGMRTGDTQTGLGIQNEILGGRK
jgi:hypothetical protein